MSTLQKELIEIPETKARFLRKFNLIAGILHAIQGVIMLVLSNDATRELTQNLPDPDFANRSFGLMNETLFDVRLGPVVASFLLMSAIAHFIIISPKVYDWYLKNLSMKMNLARWYEYALSSSVMIAIVAILCGITDVWMLLLIFVLNASMNLFGLSMEKINSLRQRLSADAKVDWTEYIFGVIAGLTPWIVMGVFFMTSINRLGGDVEVPDFVKWIFWILILTFNTFAINMFLQYKKIGPWKDYLFGEKMFIVLSLVAKTILAWQVFGGTLR